MSVMVVVGNIGSGKTLFMSCWGFLSYFSGYDIYANYALKAIKYHDLNNVTDFNDIKTKKNMFLLDELWLSADSRRSMSFLGNFMSRKVLQSRKTGESSHVMLTTQSFDQLDKRIRNIAQIIFEPSIALREEETGKPLILKVEYFKTEEKRKKIKKFYLPTFINGIDVPNAYNTLEIVDEFDNDSMILERQALIDRYKDSPIHRKSKLASVIRIEEGKLGKVIGQSDANLIADYVLYMRDMENGETE